MPTLYEMGEGDGVSHFELAFITSAGKIEVWCYGYQPTTNDIGERAYRGLGHRPLSYTHVVQKIGNKFEVYDLKTLKKYMHGADAWTIGVPVATHENFDAAVMAAMLSQ